VLWGAIIVAAGRGSRFGKPKQLVKLAGAPMLAWSVGTFQNMPEIVEIVVASEPEQIEEVRSLLATVCVGKPFSVVAGGATRQASVRAALDATSERCAAILIHDGARPLILGNDVRNGMRVVRDGTAALLAVQVFDTIKVVEPAKQIVSRTLDRQELWAAQTPQFATARDLRRAHAEALRGSITAHDDATLLERLGLDVLVVPGSIENFKVTVPEDLARAERLLQGRSPNRSLEQEIFLVEAFVDEAMIDAVCAEIETRAGTVDAIDRDLPSSVAIRAYVASDRLHGFRERFLAITGNKGVYTTHFSHSAERNPYESFAGLRQ